MVPLLVVFLGLFYFVLQINLILEKLAHLYFRLVLARLFSFVFLFLPQSVEESQLVPHCYLLRLRVIAVPHLDSCFKVQVCGRCVVLGGRETQMALVWRHPGMLDERLRGFQRTWGDTVDGCSHERLGTGNVDGHYILFGNSERS